MPFLRTRDEVMGPAVDLLEEENVGLQAVVPENELRCIAKNVEGTIAQDASLDERSFSK